jgi:hypothetical protein
MRHVRRQLRLQLKDPGLQAQDAGFGEQDAATLKVTKSLHPVSRGSVATHIAISDCGSNGSSGLRLFMLPKTNAPALAVPMFHGQYRVKCVVPDLALPFSASMH